jgi:hypothetical protein
MIARLIVASPSVKVFVAVVLRVREVIECGFMSKADDEDVIKLSSMRMTGKFSYLGLVIPITKERRERIARALSAGDDNLGQGNLRETVKTKCLEAIRLGPNVPTAMPVEATDRPKRAASLHASNIPRPLSAHSAPAMEPAFTDPLPTTSSRIKNISPSKRKQGAAEAHPKKRNRSQE